MKSPYFFGELPLKADLIRHAEEEKKILDRIDELLAEGKDSTDRFLRTYYTLLDKLRISKAELASKIGIKKN